MEVPPTMSDQCFGICRSDGLWYAGTAERKARFSEQLVRSGTFDTEEAAAIRGQGLAKSYPDETFKIVPEGGDDGRR
jgi:hypothetical protein